MFLAIPLLFILVTFVEISRALVVLRTIFVLELWSPMSKISVIAFATFVVMLLFPIRIETVPIVVIVHIVCRDVEPAPLFHLHWLFLTLQMLFLLCGFSSFFLFLVIALGHQNDTILELFPLHRLDNRLIPDILREHFD